MDTKKRKRMKERLVEQCGRCFHCGISVILESDNPNAKNLATLENKYSHWDSERHKNTKEIRYRLVCRGCLEKRDRETIKEIPIDILRAKSGSYPLGHPLYKDNKTKANEKKQNGRT